MKWFVYRKTDKGWDLIGQTRYLQDAQAILKNWHIAHIVSNADDIVEKKGY